MDQDGKQDHYLKNWLDGLQRESWQLELLISGFSIFLLIGGWEWVKAMKYDVILLVQASDTNAAIDVLYNVGRTAYVSLLTCLLFHVVLRGVWIAAIGLRSVSGDIDYGSFKFQRKFDDHLKRRIGSFDDYLERLERYCSVIFSFAFLIIFCFLSIAAWALAGIAIQYAFLWMTGGEWEGSGIFGGVGLVSLVMMIFGVIYLVDFVTLGWLKRVRFLATPYYYIYRLMGWVTLARLYRPLYYNLIDNRFGRKLAYALPIIIILILGAVSVRQVKYGYHPPRLDNGSLWVYDNFYDDRAEKNDGRTWSLSLATMYPRNDYLEVFVPYIPTNEDDVLKMIDPDLEVGQYVGTKLQGAFTVGRRDNPNADYNAILRAFKQQQRLYLNDTLLTAVEPRFHIHRKREQPGLLYVVPTHELPPGEHRIRLDKRQFRIDSVAYNAGVTVYFYK